MFRFIFFHMYEIFVVAACLLIVGVLIFAFMHRAKQNAAERAEREPSQEETAPKAADHMAIREVGLVSAGMAQTHEARSTSADAAK